MDISIIYNKKEKRQRVGEAVHFSNGKVRAIFFNGREFKFRNEKGFLKLLREHNLERNMTLLQVTSDMHLLGMGESPLYHNFYKVWKILWTGVRTAKHLLLDEMSRKQIGD